MTTDNLIEFYQTLQGLELKELTENSYETVCKSRKDCFEYIPDNKLVKMYMDMDHVFDKDFEKYSLDDAKDLILYHKYYLQCALRKVGIEPEFSVAESHSKSRMKGKKHVWGYSFHVVIHNVVALKKDIKIFAERLNKHICEDQKTDIFMKYKDTNVDINTSSILDLSVYNTGFQKFRSVHCSKDGEDRPFILNGDSTFKDMIITGSTKENVYTFVPVVAIVPVVASVVQPSCVQDPNVKHDEVSIEPVKNVSHLKYQEYAGLIQGHQIKEYTDFYKFMRASANLEIPFDIFDDILRSREDAGAYDVDKNKEMYEHPNNDSKNKLGWTHITKLANAGDEEAKIRLDVKYKAIEQTRRRNLQNSIKNELKEEIKQNLKGVVDGNDAGCADIIIQHHPNWVNCKKILYVHNPLTGMWSDDKNVQNNVISSLSQHLDIISLDGTKLTGRNYANCHKKRQDVYSFIQQKTINDNWMDKSQTSSLGYLLYKNGWFDLRKNIFHSYPTTPYDPEIVFTYTIEHDYIKPDAKEEIYMESIRERLFHTSLGENAGDYFLLQISRALAGDVMKKIMFGLGVSNSGKSVLCKAIKSSCGQYVGSYNAENLSLSMSSSDEAQKLRWAFLFKDKRIIFSNEVTTNSDLNGNIIKKISSGGDELTGRLHNGLEQQFKPQFLALVFANDLPNIVPLDDAVNLRIRIANFEKTFVSGKPKNSYEVERDDKLEDEISTLKFQRAFVNLLVKTYTDFIATGLEEVVPQEFLNAKRDWIGEDSEINIVSKLQMDYEITNNVDDFVTAESIKYWLQGNKANISSKKFGIELKRHCNIHEFSNVMSDKKSVHGKSTRVWFGIKCIQETEEICDDGKTDTS